MTSPTIVTPGSMCWFQTGIKMGGEDTRVWHLGRFQQYVYDIEYKRTYAIIVSRDGELHEIQLDNVSYNNDCPRLK